jgi:hypothetical protein
MDAVLSGGLVTRDIGLSFPPSLMRHIYSAIINILNPNYRLLQPRYDQDGIRMAPFIRPCLFPFHFNTTPFFLNLFQFNSFHVTCIIELHLSASIAHLL